MEQVEKIINTMDMREFGKHKTRTWCAVKKLEIPDYVAMFLSIDILALTLMISLKVNGDRFNLFR
uniref:Uncharacterized protein n=1 Tax=Fervidobacterium thailandense TaxID=1008305 RepID=A0A7C4GH83_9BACT